ncbi:2Fe-2S ferredoxin-type domain [Pseudocohnilembus persalinus]|uniref:2Fe-2S ferredoxin-type domain n=1 Tax=Pseudocohnilembus persalinus TaxID=266149 RepID=A0A0V0R796_PSEPJ|nr:2Fe-2S ferredoxin-type domain [Pseudocohnilembus persalinus]|eukprot:KRX10218.1 2Fe-2S ferredoxin-type domain [Pseudocohnilembus persalinus]
MLKNILSLKNLQNLKNLSKKNTKNFSTITFQIKVDESSSIPIKAETGQNFAQVLQKNKIPLEFECGHCCECGTCMVQLEDKQQFDEITKKQPLLSDEKMTLKSEGAPQQTRLSCQMEITQEFEGKVFTI